MAEASGAWARIRKNFRSFDDVWIFLNTLSLITSLPFLLRFFSLPTALAILTPRSPRLMRVEKTDKLSQIGVKFTDYILDRNIWVYRQNCLKRSIVLYRLCRRAGLDVDIYLGIRRKDQSTPEFDESSALDGHAWLVYQGRPVFERNPAAVENYTVTYRFPAQNTQPT